MTKTRKREHICHVHFRTFHHDSTQKILFRINQMIFTMLWKPCHYCHYKTKNVHMQMLSTFDTYTHFSHYKESLVPFRFKLNWIKNMILKHLAFQLPNSYKIIKWKCYKEKLRILTFIINDVKRSSQVFSPYQRINYIQLWIYDFLLISCNSTREKTSAHNQELLRTEFMPNLFFEMNLMASWDHDPLRVMHLRTIPDSNHI